MNSFQETNDLPAILFLNSYLPESILKNVLSFFGPLTIFQPWFMERPAYILESGYSGYIRVLNPPSSQRPSPGFKALLSEYHQWIRYNQDKGYTDFLRASQEGTPTENTVWEIRQMLRQTDQASSSPEEGHTLKWHLLLHLAQEVEDQRLEADRMLRTLKDKDPPLKGIAEGSERTKGLLEDLLQFGSEPIWDEYQLREIFEAWFALFGGYLRANEILVTVSRYVMDYVNELWKGPSISLKFPDLSHYDLEHIAEVKNKYLGDGKTRELRNLILRLGEEPTNDLSELEELSAAIEASSPWDLSGGTLNITLKYLASPLGDRHTEADSVLKYLSNKTTVLVQHEPT